MHKAFKLYNGAIYDLPGALRNVYWAKCNARRKQKTETQAQGLLWKATIAEKLANPKTMDGSSHSDMNTKSVALINSVNFKFYKASQNIQEKKAQ